MIKTRPTKKKQSKKQDIIDFFSNNLFQHFDSYYLHGRFGTSFRSRVSEINKEAIIYNIYTGEMPKLKIVCLRSNTPSKYSYMGI